jgi:hypothetical protein
VYFEERRRPYLGERLFSLEDHNEGGIYFVPPPPLSLEPIIPPIQPAPAYHENTQLGEAVPQTVALEDPPLTPVTESSEASSDSSDGIAPSTQYRNEPVPVEVRNSPIKNINMSATQTQTLAPVNTNFLVSGSGSNPTRRPPAGGPPAGGPPGYQPGGPPGGPPAGGPPPAGPPPAGPPPAQQPAGPGDA